MRRVGFEYPPPAKINLLHIILVIAILAIIVGVCK